MHRARVLVGAILAFASVGLTVVQAIGTREFDEHDRVPVTTAALASNDRMEGRAADDPQGSGPPWATIVYRNKDGRTCAVAGRSVDGQVGALVDGTFTPYPVHEGGNCVDLSVVPAGVQVTAGPGAGADTVVHGVAGPKVEAVEVASPAGVTPAPIGRRGGFVLALEPGTAVREIHVVAVLADGERRPLL